MKLLFRRIASSIALAGLAGVAGITAAACGAAPGSDPGERSSARDVDGGSALHETTHGAIFHGGFLPPGSTNGAGEGTVHPFDVGGSCPGGACCFGQTCPWSFGVGSLGTGRAALFGCNNLGQPG